VSLKPLDFKNFPTTRYQGSKRKILPWIYESIKDLRFTTVLDGCGGSGSASYLFKKMGKEVTYNDKLHFNYIIGKALIENSQIRFSEDDCANLINVHSDINYLNTVQTIFDDVYYLRDENEWLDLILNNIVNMNHYEPEILQYKKAIAFYALFQASLIKRPFNLFHRKNLELRTNEVERKFGNKTTWEKRFDHFLMKFIAEANNLVFDQGRICRSKNESIFEIDEYGYDLVYLDIPYIRQEGSNESSNYLRCYHFLEGMSKYSDWVNLIDYNSINFRLKSIEEQNDFTKENIHEKVEQILTKFRRSKIVFSYKIGGLPSIDFIRDKMKSLKREVYTVSMRYKYALNRQNGDAKRNREVLIIGK
jgi:adenine-specific DNA-methyltransferase